MMEKIRYGGWENCFRLANKQVELIVTGDVGPRIIHFGFLENENVFKTYPDQLGQKNRKNWLIFGGHRLWHAPEAQPRTYYPDSEPVHVQEIEQGICITQKPEPITGIQKQIEIKLIGNEPEVYLNHRLINHNLWPIETAAWGVTVMAEGGVAILPLPPRGPHPKYMLPTSILSIWPYTNLSDNRWHIGERFILLHQDPTINRPQKLGIFAVDGWCAYANKGVLFIKQVPIHYEGIYPDLGANFEAFTNNEMLELESLGPIESIPPKGQISHQEHWTLIKNIPLPQSEEDVRNDILPLL